ncbi:MAG: helix-turn-helix transcriptional regulator [Pseudomonadota bacterium]
MDLIEWIEAELKERGWSQTTAAKRGRISVQTISAVLNGTQNPGLRFYRAMARAFGVSLDEVLQRAGEVKINPPLTGADGLIRRLEALPEREQQTILTQMDALVQLAESRPVYHVRPEQSANAER